MLANYPNIYTKMTLVYSPIITMYLPRIFDKESIKFPWFLMVPCKNNRCLVLLTLYPLSILKLHRMNTTIGNSYFLAHSCIGNKVCWCYWKKYFSASKHFQLEINKPNKKMWPDPSSRSMIVWKFCSKSSREGQIS